MNVVKKDGFVGEWLKNKAGEETITLLAYRGCDKRVEVPSHMEGVAVTTLRGTFQWMDTVEEVTVPEGVITLEEDVFKGCMALKKVCLGDSVKSIGQDAFCLCEHLEEVELSQPEGVDIHPLAFEEGRYPWNQDGFLILGQVLFYYSGARDVVHIPEGVTVVKENAFSSKAVQKTMKELYFPSTVHEISGLTLKRCGALEKLVLPEGMKTIPDRAFFSSALQEITLPSSLERIKKGTFTVCPHLVRVTISPTTEVEKGAFLYSQKHEGVYSPNIVASFTDEEQSAYFMLQFDRWEQLEPHQQEEIKEGMGRHLGEKDCCVGYQQRKEEPERLLSHIFTQKTEHEMELFFELGLPLSLSQFETYLNHSIKGGNTRITAYLLDKKNQIFTQTEREEDKTRNDLVELGLETPTLEELSRRWYLERKATGVEVTGYRGGSGREVLPSYTADGVKVLRVVHILLQAYKVHAFAGLTHLKMEEGISLPGSAFGGSDVEEVCLSEGIKTIPYKCFHQTPLKRVEIPEGVEEIGMEAFSKTELEEIILPKSLKTLYGTAVNGCPALKRVVFRGSLETVLQLNSLFSGFLRSRHFTSCPSLEFVGEEGGENQLEKLREEGVIVE